jgi:hypothetical protein
MKQILPIVRNLFIVLGIAFLLVSFTVNTALAESTDIVAEPDNWGGFLISMTGPVTLIASAEMQRPFSLYILAFEDAMLALQESSVNQTHPFLSRENITGISETIPIIIPGLYGILISPTGNETVAVGLVVGRVLPQWGFVVLGAIMLAIASLVEGIKRISRSKAPVAV